MTVLTRDLHLPLAPELAWERLIDVPSWPRWMAHVAEAGWGPGAVPGPGAPLWFRFQHNQQSPRVEARVTGFRPGREFSYRPCGGDEPYTGDMSEIEWEWLLFAGPGSGTTARFTLSYEARGGMPFFRELLGTRMQVLNMADSSLRALGSGHALLDF